MKDGVVWIVEYRLRKGWIWRPFCLGLSTRGDGEYSTRRMARQMKERCVLSGGWAKEDLRVAKYVREERA